MSESDFPIVDWISGGEFMGGQKQALQYRVQGKNCLEWNCVSNAFIQNQALPTQQPIYYKYRFPWELHVLGFL